MTLENKVLDLVRHKYVCSADDIIATGDVTASGAYDVMEFLNDQAFVVLLCGY